MRHPTSKARGSLNPQPSNPDPRPDWRPRRARPRGNTVATTELTNYQYDAAGRLVKESKVSAANSNMVLATTLTYDGLDHVVEKKLTQELSGVVTELQDDSTFTYSRQLDTTLQTVANNGVEQLGFAHEAVPPFAMTSYTVKATNPSNALGLIQDTYTLTPDATGQMASIANSESQTLWNAQYDPAGRLGKIASGNFIPSHSLTSTITLDAFARKRGVVHSTGMIGSYSYDLLNRITSLYWNGLDGTGTTQSFSEVPTYDPLTGDITAITREFGKFEYGYDALDELTSSAYTGHTALGAAANRSDQLDWTGNRSTDSLNGVGNFLANFETSDATSSYLADSYGFGELSQIESHLTDDVNSFTYRADERLTSFMQQVNEYHDSSHTAEAPIVTQIQYYTDALGRRVAKQIQLNPVNEYQCHMHKHQPSSFTQSYLYLADQDKILLSKNGSGLITEYLDGLRIDEHLGEVSSSGLKAYVTDHLGSVINSSAAGDVPAYGSFGEQLGTAPTLGASSDPVAYGFAGRQLNMESSQYYNRARMYSPGVGRFTTPDPTGFEGGDANLYRYVGNNSLSASDPSGKSPVGVGLAAVCLALAGINAVNTAADIIIYTNQIQRLNEVIKQAQALILNCDNSPSQQAIKENAEAELKTAQSLLQDVQKLLNSTITLSAGQGAIEIMCALYAPKLL